MYYPSAVVRYGAYLPHWIREGGTYAVRLRLADSLPQSKLHEWREEKKALQQKDLTEVEHQRLEYLSSEKISKYLNAGYGECWLRRDDIAKMTADCLRHFHNERYELLAWCIMPNHVHVVLTPGYDHSLSNILHSWKTYIAWNANQILRRRGAFWGSEYFDHLIRNQDDLEHCIEYTWNNPEHSGLQDWKWRWRCDAALPGRDG